MLHLNLTPEFKASPKGSLRDLVPTAESLRVQLRKIFGVTAIGAVGGWSAAIVLGAALMTGASQQTQPTHDAAPPAVAAVSTPAPAPAVVASAPAPASVAPAPPAPAPTPTKTTQRIDMSPVATISDPSKLKHKHKKKKDLDAAR